MSEKTTKQNFVTAQVWHKICHPDEPVKPAQSKPTERTPEYISQAAWKGRVERSRGGFNPSC